MKRTLKPLHKVLEKGNYSLSLGEGIYIDELIITPEMMILFGKEIDLIAKETSSPISHSKDHHEFHELWFEPTPGIWYEVTIKQKNESRPRNIDYLFESEDEFWKECIAISKDENEWILLTPLKR